MNAASGHSKNKSVPPPVAEKSEPANFWDVSTSGRNNNSLSKRVVQRGLFAMKLELIGPWELIGTGASLSGRKVSWLKRYPGDESENIRFGSHQPHETTGEISNR